MKVNEFFGYDTANEDKGTWGDWLKYIGKDDLEMLIENQTPEELAEWIMDVKSREEWSAVLDTAVIETMLKANGEEGLNSEWLAQSISGKALVELLKIANSVGAELANKEAKEALLRAFEQAKANELQAILPQEDLRKQLLDKVLNGTLILTQEERELLETENGMTYAQMLYYLTEDEKAQAAIHLNGNKEAVAEGLITNNPGGLITELLEAICEKAEAEGEEPAQYLMADEAAAKLLAHFIKISDEMDQDLIAGDGDLASFGAFLGSLLTEEEIKALKDAALKESECPQTDQYIDDDPRDTNIYIGESTGEGYVYNDGNITLTQGKGDITVGHIKSERENVTLKAIEGSILASAAAAGTEGFTEHILGKNILLEAKGSIGSAEQALITEQRDNRPTIVKNVNENIYHKDTNGNNIYILRQDENGSWILDVTIDFDWMRADYAEEAERLEAKAEGSLFIEEATGDFGGTVTAGGNLSLTAKDGAIGRDDEKVVVNIGGNAAFTAKDDIAVKAIGSLEVTTESHYGKVYLDVEDNLKLTVSSNSTKDPETGIPTGNLMVGFIQAGGTAEIIGNGTIVENEYKEEPASIKADSIIIKIAGNLGTPEKPIKVNTAAGKTGTGSLSVTANTIFAEEVSGNIVLKDIEAKSENAEGDSVIITSPESIFSADEDKITDAAKAQKEANDAKDAAEHAKDKADVLKLDVAAKEAELKVAKEALWKAEETVQAANQVVTGISTALAKVAEELQKIEADATLDDAAKELAKKTLYEQYGNPEDLNKQLEKANKTLQKQNEELIKAQEEKDAKQTAYDQAAAASNAADSDAAAKAADAEAKQQAADAAYAQAKNSEPVITAPGDVTLKAQGSVGTKEDAISTEVQGAVHVTITEKADDEGTEKANEVHISSKNELTYGNIEGADTIRLTSMEGVQTKQPEEGTDEKTPVLKAETLILEALNGNLGKEDAPLIIDAVTISGMAMNADLSDDGEKAEGNIFIETIGDITIGNVDAENSMNLKVNGNVNAEPTTLEGQSNITAESLNITASGNIGTNETPLTVNVNNITLSGNNINLDAITDLVIDQIRGNNIKIHGDGDITGNPANTGNHIIGRELNITADGNIGDPLRVYIRRGVHVDSTYGTINIINNYRRGGSGDDIKDEFDCMNGYCGFGVKTGDAAEYQLYLMWMLCMAAAIVILRKKRRAC